MFSAVSMSRHGSLLKYPNALLPIKYVGIGIWIRYRRIARFDISIRIVAIILICLVSGNYVRAQYYPAPKPIDPLREASLLLQLKNTKSDKDRLNLLISLSNLYFNKPLKKHADIDKALRFSKEASALSIKLNDLSAFNNSQLMMADIYTAKDDMKSAENILGSLNDTSKINLWLNLSLKYEVKLNGNVEDSYKKGLFFAEQARKLSIKHHLPQKEIMAMKDVAMIHTDQGNPAAEAELQEVLRRYKAIGYPYLHYAYAQLAELNYDRGNPDKTIYYSIQTIKSMRATGDSIAAGDFYIWRALYCINADEYQQGIAYAKLAIDRYKIHAARYGFAYRPIFRIIPLALRKMKRYREALEYIKNVIKDYPPLDDTGEIEDASILGSIYRDMKAYPLAEKYFARAVELSKRQRTVDFPPYMNLAQLYIESGQYAKARPYLNEVLKYPPDFMISSVRRHFQYMLFLADSATRNYLAAIKDFSQYRELDDYNLRLEKDKEEKKLEVEYETKEKENAIKLRDQNIRFLNQSVKLREIRLSHADLLKKIIIGVVLVLLVITGLLYRQYRGKQKSNVIISQKNKLLEQMVEEKELLVKEVHHRVKNNLHTLLSLLESQAAHLKDEGLAAVEVSQHRIYAMSLIHQKLYQSEDIRTIMMDRYIAEFVEHLGDSFEGIKHVHFILEIEPIQLSVSLAVPIALIINEAITNSMKYAFPDKRPGIITISMHQHGEQISLLLADNGIGMGDFHKRPKANTMGLELMKGLCKEIHGQIAFTDDFGTKISLIFNQDFPFTNQEQGVILENSEGGP